MTNIELISIKGNKVVFSFEHALNLLQNFKTWSLPEDSPYKFVNNDIVKRKRRKGNSEETTEKRDNSTGDSNS